jgi:hypothetical protein
MAPNWIRKFFILVYVDVRQHVLVDSPLRRGADSEGSQMREHTAKTTG